MIKSKRLFACCCLLGGWLSSLAHADDLLDVYNLALENDPTLKQAEARNSSAKEFRDQGLARFFPVVSATASSSRNWLHTKNTLLTSRGFFPVNQEYWASSFNVNLIQPLFHWDYWVQLDQSDNQIAQAEASYNAELQNLLVRTAEAYFNILAAQDNLAFTRAEKEAISQQLEQAKARFETGIVPITDVNEAQAAFDQTTANELEAENLLDNQKEVLREIIGIRETALSSLRENLPLKKPEPDNINSWAETADTANYNIIAAFNRMQISYKNIDIQKTGHLPQLDIIAEYGATDDRSQFGVRGDNQSIGLQVNLPIFEGGAVNSRIRQARYDYQADKENLNAVKRSVKRQVNNTFRSIFTNISRIGALTATVASATSALEASEAGAEVGIRTMVDVLNEQRNVYRAKRDLSRSRYDYLINTLKLKQAASSLTQNDLEQINKLLVAPAIKSEPKMAPADKPN